MFIVEGCIKRNKKGKHMKKKSFFKENKKLLLLSFPIFIELLLQLLVGNVDQLMLSQFSQKSVAAVGNSNQIMNIAIIAINTTCAATTILISQYLGAKNKQKVEEVCNISTAFILICSIFISLFVILYNKQIFQLLSLPNELMEQACQYLLFVGSFIVVQGFYMNITAILRAYTFTTEVMIASIVMNVTNIFGNLILINGYLGFPRLGILGAAISTNISKTIGLFLALYYLKKRIDVHFSFTYFVPKAFASLKKLLRVGIPGCMESLSYNVSQVFIMKFVNTFGTSVINTKVYSSMLANVAYVYSIAIAQAVQILIGYLIGEKKKQEITKKVWASIIIAITLSVSITMLLYFNSDLVFGLFTKDPVVLKLGKQLFFIELFLEIGRSINIVMVKVLVAAGDIKAPTTVGIIFQWGIAVVFSYILGVHFQMGIIGIWIAMTIDECIRGFIFTLRFRSGVWLLKKDLT